MSQSLCGCGLGALVGFGLFEVFLLSVGALDAGDADASASNGLNFVPAADLQGPGEFFSTDGLVQDFFLKMEWRAVAGERVELVKSKFGQAPLAPWRS